MATPNKKARKETIEGKRKESVIEDVVTVDNYIGGKFVAPSSGKYLPQFGPKDGKQIGKVALSTADDVEAAVSAAKSAFEKWSAQTTKSRVQVLHKFYALMRDRADELADIVVKEHGKNKAEALASVSKGNETVEYAIGMPALSAGKSHEVSRGIECKDWRVPLGVVASIVPFNFPVMVPMWTLPIAIATGNCLILKPSEKVPQTMMRVVKLLKEAGLPDGVVNLINGQAPAVEAICDHPGIKAVTFVGSTKIAELVSKRCHVAGKRVLALGGAKNNLVALPDCNLEMCAQDIVNSYTGCTGQRCMAASALIVVGEQPELLKKLVEKSKELVPGQTGSRDLGPVIDKSSLDRITSYISGAEKMGNEILLDGRKWTEDKKEGFWIGPTIIVCKKATDPAFSDEIFGPVLSVLFVKNREEAIKIENDSPYGNAACVYTTTGDNANWFIDRFQAAMLGVNIGVPVPREPFSFGGTKKSKFGEHDITGDGGIEFFTLRRKVTTKWTPPPASIAASAANWMN